MPHEMRHLQLRLPPETRREIKEISRRLGISASDVVRGALVFGLPIFAVLDDLKGELDKRLVEILKKDARSRRSR